LGIVCGILVAAQTPASPAFEVASVKPTKLDDGRIMLGMQPGGRFAATNILSFARMLSSLSRCCFHPATHDRIVTCLT
jgi:hypothetical protein